MKDRPLLIGTIVLAVITILTVTVSAKPRTMEEPRYVGVSEATGGIWILDTATGNAKFEKHK